MLKTKKRLTIVIIFLIFSFILFSFFLNKSYDTKISLKFNDLNAYEIDNILAKNIAKKLNFNSSIKENLIISSDNYCNIYIKTKKFHSKNSYLDEINSILSKTNLNPEIKIDFSYDKNYDTYIILYSDITNLETLYKYSDIVLDNISNHFLIKKILDFQKENVATYIYFKNSDLFNLDITPNEIKKIIFKNNPNTNYFIKENQNEYFTNSKINSVDDIKNLYINSKDSKYSIKFDDIFEIRDETKNPFDYDVKYKNKTTKLIAVSKRNYIPLLLFKLIVYQITKKFPDYIKTDIINSNSKNCDLVFYKIDNPKRNNNELFEEINNDRIINLKTKRNQVLNNTKTFNSKSFKEIKEILKDKKYESSTFKTTNSIQLIFSNKDLNDYNFNKEEITDSIKSNNEGLLCGYYFKNSNKIDIYLRNKDKTDFIYSKKYKNFIPIDLFTEKTYKNEYKILTRKNGKPFAIINLF